MIMSLLPKWYLDTVVSIEQDNNSQEFTSVATGFLIGFATKQKNEKDEELYKIFLVSNKHVFAGKDVIHLRFNKGEGSRRYTLPLIENGNQTWIAHSIPAIDIAVIPILANKLQEDGVEFQFIRKEQIATLDVLKTLNITQGDGVFVLGFPMGLAGKIKKYALVRNGIIARLDDEIIKDEYSFIIDSTIFPGNSGGPVFLKPSNISIEGTTAINKAYLLGIIKSYLSYQDIAYSISTSPPQPRIVFTENAGLAYVIPLDYAIELASTLMPTTKEIINKNELSISKNGENIK
jgi:hypothetical protein